MNPRPPIRMAIFFFSLFSLLACVISHAQTPQSPPGKEGLPFPGETLSISQRQAFLIPSTNAPTDRPKPWAWYAPTLRNLPGTAEKWLFERLLSAGVAIAGIDVGESYGSPDGRRLFSELHSELTTRRGYSTRPVLLARSRGGLMTLGWAVENPGKVAAWAGIYPVANIASYPGLRTAAASYGLTEAELASQLPRHNPVDRLASLAAAGIPLFSIHGDSDKTVPLELNSGLLRDRYAALKAPMQLIIAPGQGHTMWPGFFTCEELAAFLIHHARHGHTPPAPATAP